MHTITFHELYAMLQVREVNYEDVHQHLFHATFESKVDVEYLEGRIINTALRPGFTIMQVHLNILSDVQIELESRQSLVGFCFCLSGSTSIRRWNSPGQQNYEMIKVEARNGYIYVSPEAEGYQAFRKGELFSAIYIHIGFSAFLNLMGEDIHSLPAALTLPLQDAKAYYIKTMRLSRPVIQLCRMLHSVPFSGKSREFYVEAKTIELIAHVVDDLTSRNKATDRSTPNLTQREEWIINECHAILRDNYSDPPSILKLARDFGISDYRLKNGFRDKYGITPYRFILNQRMIKARELLSEGRLNVTEVSQAVGFSSLGSFSNAFAEMFGYRPSSVKSS